MSRLSKRSQSVPVNKFEITQIVDSLITNQSSEQHIQLLNKLRTNLETDNNQIEQLQNRIKSLKPLQKRAAPPLAIVEDNSEDEYLN